jgi:hypothetical protein
VNIEYYVLEDTVEEDIVDLLQQKKSVISDVVEGSPAERWAKEMDRINGLPESKEKHALYEALQTEMEQTHAGNQSMAAEFLERMKKKMGITR